MGDFDEHDYDRAIARIHAHADEDARGFANHAPMVIDALVALDRADRIPRFLDGYLEPFPAEPAGHALEADEEQTALGDMRRAPDWTATWLGRLETAGDWRPVLARALAGLAPAAFSGATHGLIRTGHAVRALERHPSAVRRTELARALGYWCATHQTLPGRPGAAAHLGAGPEAKTEPAPEADDARGGVTDQESKDGTLDVASLMATLEVIPAGERRFGLFTEGARALEAHAPFAEAISRLHVPARIDDDVIAEATSAMLAPYFESPLARIAYIHTITAPSALRLLAAHADRATRRALYAHGVQAMAALHAISKRPSETRPGRAARSLAEDVDALRSRAADSLEEHVIKFTEACLREEAAGPDPRWRLAAADAVIAHASTTD